jgi:hypothetical protein
MKKLLVIFLLLTGTSCRVEPTTIKRETSDTVLSMNHAFYSRTVTKVNYEGCEYIVIDNGNATWGSHKGNCNNPIHYR